QEIFCRHADPRGRCGCCGHSPLAAGTSHQLLVALMHLDGAAGDCCVSDGQHLAVLQPQGPEPAGPPSFSGAGDYLRRWSVDMVLLPVAAVYTRHLIYAERGDDEVVLRVQTTAIAACSACFGRSS